MDQGWKEPRCAHSCPTGVFKPFKADAAQMARIASEQNLEVLKPELGTKPRVYYKNLSRVRGHFVGGSIVGKLNGALECIEGAEVTLSLGDQILAKAKTDAFGDFKCDGLMQASGQYNVQISCKGFTPASVVAKAGSSTFLGEIQLTN